MASSAYEYDYSENVGGHADVFKHTMLLGVLKSLQRHHPEGVVVVDAFSGAGAYDLAAPCETGLLRVLYEYEQDSAEMPAPVKDYCRLQMAVTGATGASDVPHYAGSPLLVQKILRPVDEHILADKNFKSIEGLKKTAQYRPVDAFETETSLEYLVPDTEKKLCIFIDPSYDENNDYYNVNKLLGKILDKCPTATVVIWIPLIYMSRYRFNFAKGLKEVAKDKASIGRYYSTCLVGKDKLQGSGCLVANPTKILDEYLDDACMSWLATVMNLGKDEYIVEQTMKKPKKIIVTKTITTKTVQG